MFTVKIEINRQRVADLLTSALEGGSNYWYSIDREKCVKPDVIDYSEFDKHMQDKDYFHLHWPLSEGGSLHIGVIDEDDSYTLNLDAIRTGLQVMASKYPKHWGDFLASEDDATTGDVFFQCCLFNEAVFG